jgi:hypothetical protein
VQWKEEEIGGLLGHWKGQLPAKVSQRETCNGGRGRTSFGNVDGPGEPGQTKQYGVVASPEGGRVPPGKVSETTDKHVRQSAVPIRAAGKGGTPGTLQIQVEHRATRRREELKCRTSGFSGAIAWMLPPELHIQRALSPTAAQSSGGERRNAAYGLPSTRVER